MTEKKLDEDVVEYEKTVTEKAILKSAYLILPFAIFLAVFEIVKYVYWYTDSILFVIPMGIAMICSYIIILDRC